MQVNISEETALRVFDKTASELISLVDRHTLTVQAWLSSRSPQAATFQGKGIRASSTGLGVRLLNLALGCSFPADMPEPDIEDEIETVKQFFAARNVAWLWWLNTSPAPTNTRLLLEKHGFQYDGHPLPAMAASLVRGFPASQPWPQGIRVWRAQTPGDLTAASRIRRIAFRFPEGEALSYFEDMASDWLKTDDVQLFLAGEKETEPVAMGALISAAALAGVYVMATLPEHHRKGYGKAILSRIMKEAVSQGHTIIALTASQAGFGLYSQFGFHHLFDFELYKLPL